MEKQFLSPPGLLAHPGYTHVVVVQGGKTVHISGQVALTLDRQIVGKGDLRAQTVQVFENLKEALAAAGARFTDIVKLNTYVVGLKPEDVPVLREVRGQYLPSENPPASTLVGVTALVHPDLLLEVEATAVVP